MIVLQLFYTGVLTYSQSLGVGADCVQSSCAREIFRSNCWKCRHLPFGWNSAQRTACTSSRVVTLMNLGLPESSVMVLVFTFSSTGGAGLLVAAVFCLWYSLTSLVFCLSSSAGSTVGPASSAAGAPPDLNTSSPFLKRWSTEVSISFFPEIFNNSLLHDQSEQNTPVRWKLARLLDMLTSELLSFLLRSRDRDLVIISVDLNKISSSSWIAIKGRPLTFLYKLYLHHIISSNCTAGLSEAESEVGMIKVAIF